MCVTLLAGGLLLKMLKYFDVMLKIYEFSQVKNFSNLDFFMQTSFHES